MTRSETAMTLNAAMVLLWFMNVELEASQIGKNKKKNPHKEQTTSNGSKSLFLAFL